MKFHQLFLISLIFTFGCQQQKDESAQSHDEIIQQVDSLINHWHLAAASTNFKAYMADMDSASVFIGTDASENWTKDQFAGFCKPYFDNGKAWDFRPLHRNLFVSQSGEVLWFDEILDTWMGPCIGSGVVEKTVNGWKIKHYTLSVTIPNEEIRKVVQLKREQDSVFISRLK